MSISYVQLDSLLVGVMDPTSSSAWHLEWDCIMLAFTRGTGNLLKNFLSIKRYKYVCVYMMHSGQNCLKLSFS